MQLSDLTRLHWILIGLLGGLAIAYMWTGTTDIDGIRNVEQARFERDLLLHDEKSGLPLIGKIIIHPIEEGPNGKVNVVLFKRLARDKKGNVGLWMDERLMARVPYKPAIPGRVSGDANLTIADYLAKMNQQEGGISYHYGWWLEPPKAMALGSLSGLLVVGGIWPTALGLIGGAGFGPKRSEKTRAKTDWASFLRRASVSRPSPQAGRRPITAGEGVDDVARHYEQNLAPTGSATAKSSVDDEIKSTQAETIRALDGGPLEKAAQPVVEAEEVEVKGEYYPVVIRHTKKPEQKSE